MHDILYHRRKCGGTVYNFDTEVCSALHSIPKTKCIGATAHLSGN